MSLEDVLEELNENKQKINKSLSTNNNDISNRDLNKNKNDINITLKGETIKYENRIFRLDKNASKYLGKEIINIYYCNNHYKNIKKRREEGEGPFCSMKITFYQNKEINSNYKITGVHSHECQSLYEEHNPKKKKI